MLFYSNDARETAKKEIGRLYAKLGSTKPTDTLTLEDIRSILFYLRTMESELNHEIYAEHRQALRNR